MFNQEGKYQHIPAGKSVFLDYSRKNYDKFPKHLKNQLEVQELYLRHNCLKKVPEWISELINLTDLSIYDNCLIKLPDEIGLLFNLTCLDIGRNCLKVLPKTIKNLQKLNFLSAESNLLMEIPDEIGHLQNLIVFQLSNNRLETIPPSITFCKSLYALHLGRNSLLNLPNNLAFLQHLEFLTVYSNHLLYLPSLPYTRKVHLDFSHNSYVNYVSNNFYEQIVSRNVCNRWLSHKNHENIMAFRKDVKLYDIEKISNIILKMKFKNQIKFLILNDAYKNVYNMDVGYFPSLFDLTLRAIFQIYTTRDFFEMYFFKNDTLPELPVTLIDLLVNGPVAKCQLCNNFIFTEAVIWVVPKIVRCIICIKMDIQVLTVLNFCSNACANIFHIIESSSETVANLSALKIPWQKVF